MQTDPTSSKTDTNQTADVPHPANPETPESAGYFLKKAAGLIFGKIKNKCGLSQDKVDAWQKSWLGMPETRKKYEHVADTPQVVGEELIAMSNDIIDFIQGQKGQNSRVFLQLKGKKAGIAEFLKNPAGFLQARYEQGKDLVREKAAQTKEAAEQKVNGVKEVATEKTAQIKDTAKQKISEGKEAAEETKVKMGTQAKAAQDTSHPTKEVERKTTNDMAKTKKVVKTAKITPMKKAVKKPAPQKKSVPGKKK